MKVAALIDNDPGPPLDGFTVQASSRQPERPPFPAISKQAYAKAKFGWIDQISLDAGLTSFQIAVGVRIALRHNMKNGYAHPAHKQLADDLGAKGTTGIKTAIDALVARGHVYVEYSRGAGNANRYFLILKGKLKPGSFPTAETPEKVHGDVPF